MKLLKNLFYLLHTSIDQKLLRPELFRTMYVQKVFKNTTYRQNICTVIEDWLETYTIITEPDAEIFFFKDLAEVMSASLA